MFLFSLSTFVLFRFGLDRETLEGDLASGVLWVTLLFAAVLGMNRLFVAEREEGGFDAFLLAPVDRTALFVAKAAVLFGFLVAVEVAAIPAFAVLLLGPSPFQALPELLAILLLADVGIAVIGTLVGALAIQTRARDLIVPLIALPLILPVVIAAARRPRRCSPKRAPRRSRPAGWACSGSMIWSSGCSPSRSSTSCWRTRQQVFGRGLRSLSIASLVLVDGAFALVFLYAPNDADQGFVQKIFYLHVPLAIVALGGFVAGGDVRDPLPADRRPRARPALLRGDPPVADPRRRGAGHRARSGRKASWGAWWVWDEPTLVSFLIVFLLFACYQPLRFSIEDPERQARYAAVFAIIGGAFVPLNFLAVRLAESLIHPRVLSTTGGSMPGSMRMTFLLSLVAMVCLFVTLWKYELASKHASMQLRPLQALARRRRRGRPLARTAAPTQL